MSESNQPLFTRLGEALRLAAEYPYGYALYLPPDEPWTSETRCALIDPDDVDDDAQEEPPAATAAGLKYALDFGTVQDICENLRAQTANPPADLLLRAFLHYYQHDAFIQLG